MLEIVAWSTIFTAIGFGGIVAALVTAFVNYVIKEREIYIDVSKHKMDTFSKSKHYLVQLSDYYRHLSRLLDYGLVNGIDKLDCHLCLYDLSCILTLYRRISEEFGQIRLDNIRSRANYISI